MESVMGEGAGMALNKKKKKVITLPSGWFENHLFFMSTSSEAQAPLELKLLKLFRWSASAQRSTRGWSCTVLDRKWKWGELFIHLLKYLHTICFCHSVHFEQCGCCNLFSNRKMTQSVLACSHVNVKQAATEIWLRGKAHVRWGDGGLPL